MASHVVRRGNWIWIGVIVVLSVLWFALFFVHDQQEDSTSSEPLISEEHDSVERIVLRRDQGNRVEDRVEIVRDSSTQRWSVVAPNDERAEQGLLRANKLYVEELLGALEQAMVGVVVEENVVSPLDYPDYWLHPTDGITVTITYNNQVEYRFMIGKPVSDIRSFVYDAQQQQVVQADIPRSVVDRLQWESSEYYNQGDASEESAADTRE